RAALRAIAEADSTVAFIDLSTVMPATDYAPWGLESYYVDGLHPSMKGHERIAGILHEVLSRPSPGEGSIRVDTPGSAVGEGASASTDWNVASGDTITAGALVRAPEGATLLLRCVGRTFAFTGTGG